MLAERLRSALAGKRGLVEKHMFGGVCFMLRGHMLCGTGKPGFMFRVGKKRYPEALRKGAKPMDFNGRVFEGFVWVDPGCDTRALKRWIALAEGYVSELPKKGIRSSSTSSPLRGRRG